ncbi:MAG: hypothetical protein P1V34_14835 [Alphaproteobacteria bacterium]|nr:hypothetical protein [Alphaproteobacteria bacterium]
MADFKEEDRVRDGPMDQEILTMVVEALQKQGYPDATPESIFGNSQHRAAAIEMLKDCRPMPVILSLIDTLQSH